MGRVYLCGHTGSMNRGCEALVRSTTTVLKKAGYTDVHAMTFDIAYDKKLHVNEVVDLVPYPQRTPWKRGISLAARALGRHEISGATHYSDLFKTLKNDDVVVNIGGDTYCYDGTQSISYGLNYLAEKHGITSVFWGCSVDERCLTDRRMQKDLNRYTWILPRETLTWDLLQKVVADSAKLRLVCDPAFHLESKSTTLPRGFQVMNTLGINISPLMFSDVQNESEMMYQNIITLVDNILSKTDMTVCFIPHVYSVRDRTQDLIPIDWLAQHYHGNERVICVQEELSCCELKFIISQCRFFIGARTHATIAAYSTSVPTIALSYSIKSRGIAKDLFGQEDGYAISWKTIQNKNVLTNAFFSTLVQQEDALRKRYAEVLPAYKQTILDAIPDIMQGSRT